MNKNQEQWRTTNSEPWGEKRSSRTASPLFDLVLRRAKWENVGAISGGSAVFSTKTRDDFFHITKTNRTLVLNGIIDNTLFRLEKPEYNLASQIVSVWRRQVVKDWEYLYDVKPFGFETFVEFAEIGGDRQRMGCLYRADNWTFVGKLSAIPRITSASVLLVEGLRAKAHSIA